MMEEVINMADEQIIVGTSGTFVTGIFVQHELSTHEVYHLLMKYKRENECLRGIIEEGLGVSDDEIDEELNKMIKDDE